MTERKPTCVACKGAGGGANYTAGEGIKIESNEISADTSVLATKTELEDYQPALTAGTGIDITNDEVSIDTDTVAMKADVPSNAILPIKIDNGDISLAGWTQVEGPNYSSLVENNTLKEDVLILIQGMYYYLPKGYTYLANDSGIMYIYTTDFAFNTKAYIYKAYYSRIFANDSLTNINLVGRSLAIEHSNGVFSYKMGYNLNTSVSKPIVYRRI